MADMPMTTTNKTTPARENGQYFSGNFSSSSASGEVEAELEHAREEAEEEEELPGLPRLRYNLWEHKTKLFVVTFLLVLESSLLPIALFYGLWYGTNLRHGVLFAIVTSFFGVITGFEFVRRSWKLIKPTDSYRPIGGQRWHFDFTHITLSIGFAIMTGILIGPSIPDEPIVPALALPVPVFFVQVGLQMVWSGFMDWRRKKAPFKISSVAKGEVVKPMVYTFVEDVVAVDGNGKLAYRLTVRERWNVSRRFRSLIRKMNWFWGVSAVLVGAATIVVIWTVPQEVAYGVGWITPLIYVSIWVPCTVFWARKSLRDEKREWAAEHRTPETVEVAREVVREAATVSPEHV